VNQDDVSAASKKYIYKSTELLGQEYVCGVQGSLPSWVAFTIFGVASAVGGVLSLLLPETLGSSLPDTFQDIKVSILTIVR
jgi:hypothetical protein